MDGRSVKFFRENHPQGDEFEVYGFECLPDNLSALSGTDYTLIRAAAWTENGHIRFHPGKLDGSSIYGTKKTGRVRPDRYIEVPCVDFAQFLSARFTKEDYLVVKMNIEGAEYGIIEHLHDLGMTDWIDKWYVCWHWHKIGMKKAEHDRVEAMIPAWYPWHPYGPNSAEKFQASLC